MIFSFKSFAKVIVQMALVGLTVDAARAMGGPPNGKATDQLPLSSENVPGSPARRLPTSAKWQGREYDLESGIDVLMSVARDSDKTADERHWALMGLAVLDRHLKGRPLIEELARLYDSATELEKSGILLCFKASDDPRGIPVFIRVLDKEQNMKLRLSAVAGLAQWNIRRGVAELVKILDSTEMLPAPTGMLPYVRDSALNLFRVKNIHKGWGFPDDEASALAPPDVDAGQKPPPSVAEVKKWWMQNHDRFPDWKPGDPLPEVKTDSAAPEPSPKP